jgi:hypothetical protein
MYRTRDWRRAQNDRYKRRIWNYLKHRNSTFDRPNAVVCYGIWIDKQGSRRSIDTWQDVFNCRKNAVNFALHNRKACSKFCCGNPRKWFKLATLQELKFTCD